MQENIKNKIPTGFVVPENYFETLEQKILAQTTQKPKTIAFWMQSKLWVSSVAAVLLVSFGVYFYPEKDDFGTLKTETIENYLANETTLSTDEIVRNLSNTDIENLENSLVLSDEAVENYLLEETNLNYYIEN